MNQLPEYTKASIYYKVPHLTRGIHEVAHLSHLYFCINKIETELNKQKVPAMVSINHHRNEITIRYLNNLTLRVSNVGRVKKLIEEKPLINTNNIVTNIVMYTPFSTGDFSR